MAKYQYLLFDFDGCLAQTLEIWLQAYRDVFASYDLYPSDLDIANKVFGDYQGPQKIGIKESDNDACMAKIIARVEDNYPNAELYDGAKNLLQAARNADKKIALVTSSKRSIIEPALQKHQIINLFDTVLTAEDVSKHKPDPEIIFKALEIMDGNKEQAIIIGDSKSDLLAGQAAGIASALFYPPSHQLFYDLETLRSYKPTLTVAKFAELNAFIL
jgi:HAD superfamily hydrolase (TIGR01549 family)